MLLAGPCDKRAWLRIHVHVYSFLGDEETRSDPEGPGYSGSRNSCVSVSRCFVLGRLGLISTTAAEPEQADRVAHDTRGHQRICSCISTTFC